MIIKIVISLTDQGDNRVGKVFDSILFTFKYKQQLIKIETVNLCTWTLQRKRILEFTSRVSDTVLQKHFYDGLWKKKFCH